MGALVTSVLGFVGYALYPLIGINGLTANSDLGPTNVSWYPSIGLLLSIAGCAACAIAAVIIRRTPAQREADDARRSARELPLKPRPLQETGSYPFTIPLP